MTSNASLAWIARHEIRLAWRDWVAMLTAGRRGRARNVTIGLIIFAVFLHLPAYALIERYADVASTPDKTTLIVIASSILLAWALMLSQAMESVTRVFYSRADLDLIMSSPIPLNNIFSIRMAAIALTVTVMALLLSLPFVDVLIIGGRLAMAVGVRHGRRHRDFGGGGCDIPDHRLVPDHRPETDAVCSADPGRRDRRGLRHRAAGRCRDPVYRHDVALFSSDLGCRSLDGARDGQSGLVAGEGLAWRRHGAAVLARWQPHPAGCHHCGVRAASWR
jgi:hypothetical protein